MRLQVTLLRDKAAEKRAKERAEAPTVKTEEQMKHDEAIKAKEKAGHKEVPQSIWRRKFRPLQEPKAVDLFADVVGDAFILFVAVSLILYEYIRATGKPDVNTEKIAELNRKLDALEKREQELEETEKTRQKRVETLEDAIEEMKKASAKKRLLSLS